MEERKCHVDEPEASKDEALRAAMHSFYRIVAELDAESIKSFRDTLSTAEQLSIFDAAAEDEQMRIVAISKLTAEEIQLLSAMGIYAPGLHDVRAMIGCYTLLLEFGE